MINSVVIMGRLTFDPELRTTPTGVSVVRFQVACDRNYQNPAKKEKPILLMLQPGAKLPNSFPAISAKAL